MEINARLQVEHPVTEYLTGIDIVKWQLMIASGEEINFSQADVEMNGHAIEARVYAEDPETFVPSPGTISSLRLPGTDSQLRIDHALKENGNVPPYYDPLLAKVIAWGSERAEASNRLIEALADIQIEGIKTTIPVNLAILKRPEFLAGKIDTGFIDNILRNKF
jgi:acetyl-CoA carboxylase biotin carboxylase subunit